VDLVSLTIQLGAWLSPVVLAAGAYMYVGRRTRARNSRQARREARITRELLAKPYDL
jgi:hypothetical protein